MPKTSAKLWTLLGAEDKLGALQDQRIQDAATWGQLPAGAVLTKGEALFPRLEES
jgi:methionyl-tRNA synthetase